MHQVFHSILDNDVYKFTMQNVIFTHYKKDIPVVYQFTNRQNALSLNAEAVEWLQKQIDDLENVILTKEEQIYLSTIPYFQKEYIQYLAEYRYKPKEQVHLSFDKNTRELELKVTGTWLETILYEVPLLSLISEAFFQFVDKDWNYEGQVEQAAKKTVDLLKNNCDFAELGTRRRRDFKTQELVVRTMFETFEKYKNETEGEFKGTSNFYLAMKYQLKLVGTMAHEFFMGISAIESLEYANREALKIWHGVYQGQLSIALTDTFTTPVFFKDFQHDLAILYDGVRNDSGDPIEFADAVVDHYKSLGIDPSTKIIVFSDSLTVDKSIQIKKHTKQLGIKCSFGIGTHFTNDFKKTSNPTIKSKAMNIVIKMKECEGKRVFKLSDDPSKHSADDNSISVFKRKLGI